ncbi:MAG: hypothetical protein ACREJ2_04255 [Planctomycetota bacterium]
MPMRPSLLVAACFVAVSLVSLAAPLSAADAPAPRDKVRVLFTFENAADLAAIKSEAENVDASLSADNGVTEGKTCARLMLAQGKDKYAVFTLGKEAIKDWAGFDYFAMDVYSEEAVNISFELWDHDSKNYATRCTIEPIAIHPGKNAILIPINRACRNNKTGLDWNELETKDKIDLNNLKMVKIFTGCAADHPIVLWVDNVRLMQEDAAKPKFKVKLPDGALAFDFGATGAACPGFKSVGAKTAFADGDCGLAAGSDAQEAGDGWPDGLTGTFLTGDRLEFKAKVPNGKYKLWLCAGKVLDEHYHSHYLLQANDTVLCDEKPTRDDYFGEQYYFRFLHTQYSRKPHAVWINYLSRMYAAQTADIEVTDGAFTLKSEGHFLCAAILVPAAAADAFTAMTAQLQADRIAAFEKSFYAAPLPTPEKMDGDGDYVLWQPGSPAVDVDRKASEGLSVGPFTFPTAADRKANSLVGAGAPGQRVVLSLAVLPFTDLGHCTLKLADLAGPGPNPSTIPAGAIHPYFQNYRSDGADVSEMCLLPGDSLNCEAAITQVFWLWIDLPADAKPGAYTANFTFTPTAGTAMSVPVKFEVYPFHLEQSLPYSFGMYGWVPPMPDLNGEALDKREIADLQWARAIGFTARAFDLYTVGGVGPHGLRLTFHTHELDLAKQCGFGANPDQLQMCDALGIGRTLGRTLLPRHPGEHAAPVDANPGVEFTAPNFKELWYTGARQLKEFLDKQSLPFAVQCVDEPREMPNPWNRNLADTIRYADWLKDVGLKAFCTPMSDGQSGRDGKMLDYTQLVDHLAIVSVHAGKVSERLVAKTLAEHKTLWFYNTGMDRFSWGFFNWRTGSKGRWEWNMCSAGSGGVHGYPGDEWYNPFTAREGMTELAPLSVNPQGILWQSLFFQVAQGINDTAYLVTLEEAIAANKTAGTNLDTVKQAEEFLAALKKVIPMTPGVQGLSDAGAGALVGQGAQDQSMALAPAWRVKIADFLKVLAPAPAPKP